MTMLSKFSNRLFTIAYFPKYFLNYSIPYNEFSNNGITKTKSSLIHPINGKINIPSRKVSIVGAAGLVGTAIAINLLITNLCDEIVLMDINEKKLLGETMDLKHGTGLIKCPKLSCSTNFANTADSDLIIITSGISITSGQSRLDIVNTNARHFEEIIPEIVKYSPNSILLIVSNPVDIMTYLAWKFSCFDKHKVIGNGTELDSSRFRYLISERLGINPTSVQAYIIGEHGDSSVPLWSGVSVAGTRLQDINSKIGTECDPEKWNEVHKEVVKTGYVIHDLKGCTNWAVSISVQVITRAILTNAKTIHTVSTQVKGIHDIESDVFLSLPCVLGNKGITSIITQCLTNDEKEKLQRSASILDKIKNSLKL